MAQIGKDVPSAAFSGARSRDILIAQVLVDRSRHSPGVIDGYDGGNTRRALKAFESANGMKADGQVDDELMRKLSAKLGDGILTSYTITSEDLAGPFKPMPDKMTAMAKRDALGFTSVQELLSEKFHMMPGKTASHGCVRLTNWDAAELAIAVQPGTTQVILSRLAIQRQANQERR